MQAGFSKGDIGMVDYTGFTAALDRVNAGRQRPKPAGTDGFTPKVAPQVRADSTEISDAALKAFTEKTMPEPKSPIPKTGQMKEFKVVENDPFRQFVSHKLTVASIKAGDFKSAMSLVYGLGGTPKTSGGAGIDLRI